MENIAELIKNRRSVRTYDGRIVDESIKAQLTEYAQNIKNPIGIPVEIRLLDGDKYGLNCPVMTGTELFAAGKIKQVQDFSIAFGFSFEAFVLYAQSLGLGTVWLGGTMNREAFEKAMELKDNEVMPCASPIGYTSDKMSIKESLMRKTIKADSRKDFEELFYAGDFETPLTPEKAGVFLRPLEMVRLAPSAVNKQPWRVVVADDAAHFYIRRSKGFGYDDRLDMQMIDMGIALCHFVLTAEEEGLKTKFVKENTVPASEFEYIGTMQICR